MDKKVSIRINDELAEKLKLEKSAGELIRTLLEDYYGKPEAERIIEEKAEPVMPIVKPSKRALRLPVGDVLMAGQPQERVELWWLHQEGIDAIKEIAKKFDGLALNVGRLGKGTDYMPEVIVDEWQERKRNGCFTPSCRMDEALIGDKLVWMEVVDSEKALATLEVHTDIPCPIRVNVIKYNNNERYRLACDTGNKLFTYYFKNKKPYDSFVSTSIHNVMEQLHGV